MSSILATGAKARALLLVLAIAAVLIIAGCAGPQASTAAPEKPSTAPSPPQAKNAAKAPAPQQPPAAPEEKDATSMNADSGQGSGKSGTTCRIYPSYAVLSSNQAVTFYCWERRGAGGTETPCVPDTRWAADGGAIESQTGYSAVFRAGPPGTARVNASRGPMACNATTTIVPSKNLPAAGKAGGAATGTSSGSGSSGGGANTGGSSGGTDGTGPVEPPCISCGPGGDGEGIVGADDGTGGTKEQTPTPKPAEPAAPDVTSTAVATAFVDLDGNTYATIMNVLGIYIEEYKDTK